MAHLTSSGPVRMSLTLQVLCQIRAESIERLPLLHTCIVGPIFPSLAIPILIQPVPRCFRNTGWFSCVVMPSWSFRGTITHHVCKYGRVSSISLLFSHQIWVLVLATVSIRIANSIPSPQTNFILLHFFLHNSDCCWYWRHQSEPNKHYSTGA